MRASQRLAQQVVPKITFAKMLERALSPPDDSMVLPYSKCVCVFVWVDAM